MKFTCTQENLKKGLNLVSHLAGKNKNLPVLNNVLIEVKNGILFLATTNLEIGIKSTVRGKMEQEGVFTVPAKLFNDYIQSLRNENIELKWDEKNLSITTKNSQTVIKGLDASEFPLIPEIEKKNTIKVMKKIMKKSLSSVLFATAMDTTRPEISGVLFDFQEDGLTLVATDSYRLAEKKVEIINKGFEKKVIIPSFSLQELNRVLSDMEDEGELTISLNDNQILFEVDSTRMVSRITEGEYPDYKQVIPTETKTKTIVKRNDFQQIIKAASLFCRQGINDIHLIVLKDKIEVKAVNDQLGESQNIIEAIVKGDQNDIIFNYHYILDVLNIVEGEEIEFNLNNKALPGVVKAKNKDDYLYIIMPIKQ